MFLIQFHGATHFWKKIGLWTYFIIVLEWVPVAYIIQSNQIFFLQFQLEFSNLIVVIGFLYIFAGIGLHSWTAILLGLEATIGYTEIKEVETTTNPKLIVSGPFSIVGHPSYWAHTSILFGTFLVSGLNMVGILTLI